MQLYEYEGKQLFKENGIPVPDGFILRQIPDPMINSYSEKYPELVLKAQLLQGSRQKKGAVKFVSGKQNLLAEAHALLGSYICGEEISSLLIEQKLNVKKEIYLACVFDTTNRMPCLIISSKGGVDVEQNDSIIKYQYNPLDKINEFEFRNLVKSAGFEGKLMLKISSIFNKLYNIFHNYDCKLVEINPLVVAENDEVVAVDSVVILDDDSFFRHNHPFPLRQINRLLTEREHTAKLIDSNDHRGVSGRTFIELDGDIGILSSGGGASMTVMDALISYGGKPANYTEYSGNPTPEKVEKLAKVVLSMSINGLWIVGGTANFTDIKATLVDGILKALKEIKPKYPIVIRRAGPNDKEAFEIIKKEAEQYNLDIHLYDENTSMTESAKILLDLVKKYKESKNEGKKIGKIT